MESGAPYPTVAMVVVLGIGFMPSLTINIAAWFVERGKNSGDDEIQKEISLLREETHALRMTLDQTAAAAETEEDND